jgi:hypothetical protein
MHLIVEYFVLKQGRTEGPFSETDLIDSMSSGRFTPDDLGQEQGARYWTPLRRLLVRDTSAADAAEPAAAPEEDAALPASLGTPESREGHSNTFAGEAATFWRNTAAGARTLVGRFPFETGIACCMLAVVALALSYARILIVAPMVLLALIAGGMTMLRGRVMGGLIVCAAAIFAPTVIWAIVQYALR